MNPRLTGSARTGSQTRATLVRRCLTALVVATMVLTGGSAFAGVIRAPIQAHATAVTRTAATASIGQDDSTLNQLLVYNIGKCLTSTKYTGCLPIQRTTYGWCSYYAPSGVATIHECGHGTVYSVKGYYVWGSTATVEGLTGSKVCHDTGSNATAATYSLSACGEHRDTLRYDKIWDMGDIFIPPSATELGSQYTVAVHINCYDSGQCFGPYNGLGS